MGGFFRSVGVGYSHADDGKPFIPKSENNHFNNPYRGERRNSVKQFLKVAGIILLQFIIGIVIFLVTIRIVTNAEMHYAGSANYGQMVKVAETHAELAKNGGEE